MLLEKVTDKLEDEDKVLIILAPFSAIPYPGGTRYLPRILCRAMKDSKLQSRIISSSQRSNIFRRQQNLVVLEILAFMRYVIFL